MLSASAAALLSGFLLLTAGTAQSHENAPISPQVPTVTVRSNLVLVPALVKTKSGEIVFSLTADEFALTDNGVSQPVRIETDTDSQPLALAVIVQTGGLGALHLADYRGLDAVLDSIVGGVPHLVAVVGFDSTPHLEQAFTPDINASAGTIATLRAGDGGAAFWMRSASAFVSCRSSRLSIGVRCCCSAKRLTAAAARVLRTRYAPSMTQIHPSTASDSRAREQRWATKHRSCRGREVPPTRTSLTRRAGA